MILKKHKLSLLTAVCAAIILLILRTVQLLTGVEYPSGFCLPEGQLINNIFNILLVITGIALAFTAFLDCKPLRGETIIPSKASAVYGGALIVYGAATAATALSQLSNGSYLFGGICLIGTISAIAAGMMTIVNGEVRPSTCVPVIILIVSFIVKNIVFYVSNPIITGIPQKLMVMTIYVLSLLFWINIGRMFSGGEKKLTRAASIASGFALGCVGTAYIGSSFLVMALDGEKWLLLDNTPDIELIAISLIPALLAGIMLFVKPRTAVQSDEAKPLKPVKKAAPDIPEKTSEPENTTAVPKGDMAAFPNTSDIPDTADFPAESKADIPAQSTVDIPAQSTVDIPAQNTADIPNTTDIPKKEEVKAPEHKEFDKYDIDAILDEYSKK